MTKVRFQVATTLDGYMAAPDQTREKPFGEGMDGLHDWMFKQRFIRETHGWGEGGEEGPSNDVMRDAQSNIGAVIMGRKMFGPVRGGWETEPDWTGWWGDNPPFHTPVFVLTHYERETVTLKGNNSFIFVTDGIESALEQARAVCPPDQDILISGGASAINQYLKAGLVDEFWLHIVPFTRGEGENPLAGVQVRLEQVRAVEGDGVTHLKYRVPK
ncbi:MAG: dihydrofolate reductase family protein [Dehalococcoidia bacterium]